MGHLKPEIERLFRAKEARRVKLAALPFPEKVLAVVQMQRMAAPLAHIIHERFCFNRDLAAATSLAAACTRPGGRARPSRPQRTVSSTLQPLGAPRARLDWQLRNFATNRHE
jgi:hypothetical protein